MGLEASTIAGKGRKRFTGKLHLDSKFLTFKGPDFQWAVALTPALSAESKQDLLVIQNGSDRITFEIGANAAKWVEKILNPPNRITKLGIKPEQKFWLSRGFQKSFADELRRHGAKATRQIENCEIAFWLVSRLEQLSEFDDIADRLPEGVNLWVVWKKGSATVGQTAVMERAKSLGFGPSKTAAFDDQHSSMRFAKKRI